MTQPRPVRVIAVTSGKGGVGKTNVAVNLGVALAALRQRVALLDADLGLANVDVLLGLHPQFNLTHVLSGERGIAEIFLDGPGGIKVIPASSGVRHMSELSVTEQAGIIRAFSGLDQVLDVLIVDTAAGVSSSVINFAIACQEIIVVVCDEPTSLADAYALIKMLNRYHGVNRMQVITNMVRDARHGQQLYEKLCATTDRFLDVLLNHLGSVPFDEELRKAVKRQRAVVEAYPASSAAAAFQGLARKIDAIPLREQLSGQLEFFMERMLQVNGAQAVGL